ncbi:MAG: hypothetical protein ACI82A_004191, partial [Candidatus Azotimanducaceae bacterium]
YQLLRRALIHGLYKKRIPCRCVLFCKRGKDLGEIPQMVG